ncbi:toxin [Pseudomonas paralactis]|uniref:Tc toxin subunit A n=1 Tax=Pseudomonas paralactis TaxID=1615673 RepID=UPI00164833DC|nr:Tc toxin subunit A [Pseudomonas paralactis]MBC3256000.1 toxin [Pseudomonas paralactis]
MDTHSPTYTRLFKEDWELLCSASSMAAIDSPVAYLKALYVFAQTLENSENGQTGKVTLDQRRPELKALPIDERSLTAVIPQLSIINETLAHQIDTYLTKTAGENRGRSLDTVLGLQRFPFALPFERAHRQCWLSLSAGKPQLGELSYRISLKLPTTQRAQNAYGVVRHAAYEAQRLLCGLSPAQQNLLTEPFLDSSGNLHATEFFARHYGLQEESLRKMSHWLHQTELTRNQAQALLACGRDLPVLSGNVSAAALPRRSARRQIHERAAYVNGPITENAQTQQPLSIANAELQNTSWNRYQRLHRMIRLQRWTQLPFEALDALLISVVRREQDADLHQPCNDNTLRALGVYRYLERRYGLPLEGFAAMLDELPVWASGNRLSLYDQVFNHASMPGETLRVDVPNLALHEALPDNLRHRLCAGLNLGDTPDALHWVIGQARRYLPSPCPTLTFYSALYRQARIARLFGLSVLDSHHVAALLGGTDYTVQLVNPSLRRSGVNAPPDMLDVLMQMDWLVGWLKDTRQSVDQLRRRLVLEPDIQPAQIQAYLNQLDDLVQLTRQGLLASEDIADLTLPQPEPDTRSAPIPWHALIVQGLLHSPPQFKPSAPTELPRTLVQLIEARTLSLDPDRNAAQHAVAKHAITKKLGEFYRQLQPLKDKIDALFSTPSNVPGDPALHLQSRRLAARQIARTATAQSHLDLVKHLLLLLPDAEELLELAVSRQTLNTFLLHPHWLSQEQTQGSLLKLTLNTLYLLQRFAHCLDTYGLAQDSVLDYLQRANTPSPAGVDTSATTRLAALLKWEVGEIEHLAAHLPNKQVNTLADLDWILRCHQAVRLTGLCAKTLLKATDLHATLMNEDWRHVGSALITTAP